MDIQKLIGEIKARAEVATPGPWDDKVTAVYKDNTAIRICGDFYDFERDADFIAHSREDIPWLLERKEQSICIITHSMLQVGLIHI